MRSRSLQLVALFMAGGSISGLRADPADLLSSADYCLEAQKIVSHTSYPVKLEVHETFEAFVKSKALIDGPTIHQFNWRDANGLIQGISCKLKSADHLNLAFGEGTAGPDGTCQDMNRAMHAAVADGFPEPRYPVVVFDPKETVINDDEPGMTGPDWLAPYTGTELDDAGTLQVRSKGFQVNFLDPRYQSAPARFRGVHYCHLIAPEYMRALLAGSAAPGNVIGREVDASDPMSRKLPDLSPH